MTKKKQDGLGRALQRHMGQRHQGHSSSDRHTTQLGLPDSRVSITENTSLDEFLSNAEASQRSFETERSRLRIIQEGVDEEHEEEAAAEDNPEGEAEDSEDEEEFSSIPRKPDWKTSQSAEEFHRLEQLAFLKWKKRLNRLQVKNGHMPPFEKNLEFWRQLWKILEISDIVVQVVDARDPLFFYSEDLAKYVKEISAYKINVMLVNKSDYLDETQRQTWAKYFDSCDIKAIFFSALNCEQGKTVEVKDTELEFNCPHIFEPSQVLNTLKRVISLQQWTVGFLGYPNVGKSSTINCFLTDKKLPVSATPGKTKHYQTHAFDTNIKLVDGPGLVIPNLNMTKADMLLAGILPIDNLTDYAPAMNLLLTKVPFLQIQNHYGIMKNCIASARKTVRKDEALQILSALGLMRGFMKPGGVPDDFKAAKLVLKDFVQGKLFYCKPPPNVTQEDFFVYSDLPVDNYEEDLSLEESFPELRMTSGVHVRGNSKPIRNLAMAKKNEKHKKKKARRLYKDPYQ